MAKFAYNNVKNISSGHTPFKLNYEYYLWISYKYNVDLYSKSKSIDKLLIKLRELIIICKKNLYHAQEL